jgi:hypothetical protein
MFDWHHVVTAGLRRGRETIQEELRALEQDLGLCAACGETRPLPFSQRRREGLQPQARPEAERLVA